MPEAIKLRIDGPPQGYSSVGHVATGLKLMAGYNFYTVFKERFQHEIAMANAYYLMVVKDPCSFHHLHNLFKCEKKTFPPGEIAVNTLAPYICGYIMTLNKKDSLTKAKAIFTKYQSHLQLAEKFSEVIRKEIDS